MKLDCMQEYICHTNRGKWKFYAEDDIDAMRVALYYCYLDREELFKIESGIFTSKHKTLRICLIDDKNTIFTL